MILSALVQYYEQLIKNGQIDRPGWQKAKVSFALRLDENGELRDLVDLREEVPQGKKTVLRPQNITVPEQVKRSVGIMPNFLCDNAAYMLGLGSADNKRIRLCYDDCAKKHKALLCDLTSPAAKAVCAFFDKWNPSAAAEHPLLSPMLKELSSANLIFVFDSAYVQDDDEVMAVWNKKYQAVSDEDREGRCLVTGDETVIARLHPAIKGVQGAQTMGASLVSFNAPAFESYGHDGEQGGNAPVGKYAAFAYGAALNYLLQDKDHVLRFGDTTVVFWAETAEEAYADFLCQMMNSDDKITDNDMKAILERLRDGLPVEYDDTQLDPDCRFYVLGLAPNAARLSVRFFEQNRFGKMIANVAAHQERMQIIKPVYEKYETLPLWKVLLETVNPNARDKSASPQMAGDMLRAILTDGRYPTTLYTQVQLRIRAEHEINYGKAGIIKAYLTKNVQNEALREGLTVKLDETTTYTPYVLGRLFAVLEQIQTDANPGINTTIRDRFFSSACTTPAVVFPRLVNLAQAHLKKMSDIARFGNEKRLRTLFAMMDESYPKQLDLNDQGIFQLGYYHQTQKRFEKKEDK